MHILRRVSVIGVTRVQHVREWYRGAVSANRMTSVTNGRVMALVLSVDGRQLAISEALRRLAEGQVHGIVSLLGRIDIGAHLEGMLHTQLSAVHSG